MTPGLKSWTMNLSKLKLISVKFRVILMQMDLKPYSDPITVLLLVMKFKINSHKLTVDCSFKDPEGYIMRRWPSQYPTNGS